MKQKLSGLLRPATLRRSMYFSLSMTAHTSHKASEGDDLFLVDHIFQVGGCSVQRHLLDGLGRLTRVLECNMSVIRRFAVVAYTAFQLLKLKIPFFFRLHEKEIIQ